MNKVPPILIVVILWMGWEHAKITKLNKVINHLNKASEVRVGGANFYVGLHITMNCELSTLYIDQTYYILWKLKKFGYGEAHVTTTPIDVSVQWQATVHETAEEIFLIWKLWAASSPRVVALYFWMVLLSRGLPKNKNVLLALPWKWSTYLQHWQQEKYICNAY